MVYKMLAMNIDGTLLQDNGRINKLTREAIDYAQGKDIEVTLVTSKDFPAAKRIAKSMKINGYIVSHHGGYIAKEYDKPIIEKRIDEKITREIVAMLESFSCQIKLVHERFTIGNKVKLPEHMMAKVVFQTGNRFSYPEQYVDVLSEHILADPVSPPTIAAVFESRKDLSDVQEAIGQMYDEVSCIVTGNLLLEIVVNDASKLNGLKYICNQLGIEREEVVAIGSGMDDQPMVEWAGLGVAMGNAPKEVKEVANWITRSNNDNGVAYMVKEHFRKQYKLEFLKKNNMIY